MCYNYAVEKVEQLKSLYSVCFDDPSGFVDYFFERYYNPNRVVYNEVDGRIVSAIHLIYKTANIRGADFVFPFATAVSTLPEYRKRGYAANNMFSSINLLSSKNIGFLALYPVNSGFYLPFGYVTINGVTRNTVKYSPSNVEVICPNSNMLFEVYSNKFQPNGNYLVRSREDYKRLLGDWKSCESSIRYYNSGNKTCYCVLSDGKIEEAVGDVELLSVDNDLDGLTFELPDGNIDNTMCRIVDVETVLTNISYDNDGELYFTLTDDFFPKNNGIYHLTVSEKRGALEKVSSENTPNIIMFEKITIQQLTQWVLGKGDVHSDLLKPINFVCYDKY